MMSTTGDVDVDVANDREEGELEDSDLEEGTYIPLKRPDTFNPPSLVNMQIQDDVSDEASALESSGSESDDEPRRMPKRTKFRPKRPQPHNDKKNKYNIWCKTLQEELLTEDMVSCDVTKKDKRYGVESYDYTIKYRLDDNFIPTKAFTNNEPSNKRRQGDRGNVKLRLGKRVNSNCKVEGRQEPRILGNLKKTTEDPEEELASEIAENLEEEKKDLIGRIVSVLGASKAIEIYKETQRLEAEGGMLIMNGTRRRTPGGIYFFLLKRDDDISQEMVSRIFTEERKEATRRVKRARIKSRESVMEQLKQTLTDSSLPSLLSRGEAATSRAEPGSNPPPSPATDARDCSSDTDAHEPERPPDTRQVQSYEDDDFLEVMCNDDMDLF